MHRKIIFASLIAILCIAESHAQVQNIMNAYNRYNRASAKAKRLYQRDYLGYGMPKMNIEVWQHYTDDRTVYGDPTVPVTYTSRPADTIIRGKYSPSSSLSYTEGTFIPMFKIGREGMFAIDISASTSVYQYAIGKIDYSSNTGVEETGIVQQYTFPIALVYKSGGEVNLNKKSKVLFTAGGGICPGMTGSKIIAFSDIMFTAQPYGIVEFGIFAGLAWKIRATFYTKKLTLLDNQYADIFDADSYHTDTYGNLNIKVTGQPGVMLSLLVNPFSWDWKGKGDNYSPWNKGVL